MVNLNTMGKGNTMNKTSLQNLYLARLDAQLFLDTHPGDVGAEEYLMRVSQKIIEREAMEGGVTNVGTFR